MQMVEGRHGRALPVVADAGVDQDRPVLAADQPGLDHDTDLVGGRVEEVGGEPVLVRLPVLDGHVGEYVVAGASSGGQLHHTGDPHLSEREGVHTSSLRAGRGRR